MATLRTVLGRAWERRFPRGTTSPWAGHLQPSHIQRWIMRAVARYPEVLLADVERSGGLAPGSVRELTLPAMSSALEHQTGIEVRAWIDTEESWALVVALATVAHERALAVHRHFTELDPAKRPDTTAQRISEWACTVVARPYVEAPALPKPDYLDDEQAMFQQCAVDRAARVKKLVPDTQFATRYSAVYDAMWDRFTGLFPVVASPTQLDLGTLDRPPMRAVENSWRVGTDRSVLSRYRYHLRGSWSRDPGSVADTAGLDLEQHISSRLLRIDPDELCRGELDRVCSPLGLRYVGHHTLVTAMVQGVRCADLERAFDRRSGTGSPLRRGSGLTDWAVLTPDLPAATDQALQAGVQEYAEFWAFRSPRVLELATGAGPLIHWPRQVELGAPRRLWHRLHCREVEWETPFRSAEAARLVPQMFQKHLLELLKRPIADPDPDPDPDPGAEQGPVAPDDPRLRATLRVLGTDPVGVPEMVQLLLAHDPEWEAGYRRITGPHEADCLTMREFRYWALRHYGDVDMGGR